MNEAAEDAARTHVELLGHQDPRVCQRSANAIQDRAGVTKGQSTSQVGNGLRISKEQLNLLALAIKESGVDPNGQALQLGS